ncbi:transposase [Lentilactobacillus sp. Marseille-Q4993]|uniref:transposase n=1 Tax=Lentilactobacillus sp. Marseille-Q4993 TaxID=3039492 RepID=UPI0024BCA78E|nr:transposase [Lentilactobacillus sp. Marseille-Q4993]
MTKYSEKLKIRVVKDYLQGVYSYNDLKEKYQISSTRQIHEWVSMAKANGLEALRYNDRHKTYSPEFKLTVVDYYKANGLSFIDVATHFNISPSQVFDWNRRFNQDGIGGLRSKTKGRQPMKKKKTVRRPKLGLSEKDKYEEEILNLKEELYHTKQSKIRSR